MKGENYLLTIAIDNYSDDLFLNLENAVFDATRFSEVLFEKYGFSQIQEPLYNEKANRKNIIDSLNNLSTALHQNDNLIIYHAGHGMIHPKTGKGFWIPYDGSKDSISNYIRNSDIIECLEAIDSKHILLITDSCFSGTLITKTRGISDENYYLKAQERKSRYIFSSGREEKVSDGRPGEGSPFANELIKFLKNNTNQYFSFSEMASIVKKATGRLTTQQPISGTLGGVDFGGEMVFKLSIKTINNLSLKENKDSWETNFKLFCDAKETRREWPFISKENPETKSLGIWCQEQRRYKRIGKLASDRELRLLNAGFIFDPQMQKFFRGLGKFLSFMEKEKGYNYIPQNLRNKYKEEEAWLKQQQKWFRKLPCDPTNPKAYPLYRFEILKKNGILLVPMNNKVRWEIFQNDLIKYYKSHDRYISLPSQLDKNPEIASLGNRLNDYMVDWKRNKLSIDKIKFLEGYVDINYGRNKIKREFQKQVNEYLNFKKIFPKSEPKQSGKYRVLANRLAQWKSKKGKGKLPLWQEKILIENRIPFIPENPSGLLF